MKDMQKHREKSANSVAQLVLPGLDAQPAARPFDLFALIRETFRLRSSEGEIPAIQVSRRMLRTLGSFTPSKNVIRLSSRLLALGTPAEQKQVALHEVAHALVHQQAPKASAHGREFKVVCRELGLDESRFVQVDHEAWRARLRFTVECPSCGNVILRRKRASKVRCECGTKMRPRDWTAVGLTESGLKPL